MTFWIGTFLFVLLLLVLFIVFAKKGRKLRTEKRKTPAVTRGSLHWREDGREEQKEVTSPFYLGRSAESNIILPEAAAAFEVCIFYHDRRFAIQVLEEGSEIYVNGAEMIAGYLRDGDELEIARQKFTFRCY